MTALSSQRSPGDAEAEGEVNASNLLQAGVKAHKLGDTQAAEELYVKAMKGFGIPVSVKAGEVAPSAEAAELLHLLGALRVQKLVGNPEKEKDADGSDSEDGAEVLGHHAAEELAMAVEMLRAAVAALPAEEPPASRARVLSSLGIGLLHSPSECQKRAGSRSAMSSGSTLSEAVDCLREATTLDEGRWSAWFNLSRALAKLKDEKDKMNLDDEVRVLASERVNALRRARSQRPKHPGVLYKLGMSLKEKGDAPEAIDALETYLHIAQDDSQASSRRRTAGVKHWLAVLKGETSATAPAEYVAGLFDCYADRFDEHLVDKLDYRTPELLADELRKAKDALMKEAKHETGADLTPVMFKRCADLGCGTGLMGPPLRDLGVEWLEGVDLSSKMLKKARDKQRGYDKLVCGDLLELFKDDENPVFDLVVAADVFVYVGDLQPALAATARCLARPHGVVAFSTEAPPRSGSANENEAAVPEGSYRLAETGRYLHSASYVRLTAEACGLNLWTRTNVVLRKNGGKPVYGHLHVLRPAL